PSDLGLDTSRPGSDLARGAALAAVIGGPGPGPYPTAVHPRGRPHVGPEGPPPGGGRVPVPVPQGLRDGVPAAVVGLAALVLRRLDQLGWSPASAIALSAVLRGSYHLYQGLGGFLGNAAMGVVFGILFHRWRRVTPFIVAHTLIDAVAFVGYAALHGHVSWLP